MINNFLLDVLTAGAILSGILVINSQKIINSQNCVIAVLFLILKTVTKTAILIIASLYLIAIIINSNCSELGNFSDLFNNLLSVRYCVLEKISSSLILLSYGVPIKQTGLTKKEQEAFSLPEDLKHILVGLLLGDLYAEKRYVNASLCFCQGLVHKEYLDHLYKLFSPYCSMVPIISSRAPDKRTGVIYSSIRFNTRSLPCFNELYNLFYSSLGKYVPSNIGELLTPLGLCYWICDDGCLDKRDRVIYLNTQGFTKAEVEVLAKTLNDKWNLECTINNSQNGFRIRIPRRSLPILQSLLKDSMPPMMLYKIGL